MAAVSSVKLGLLRRMAELRPFPTSSPQSSRGQRKAITSLVFVAAQHMVGRRAERARQGALGRAASAE